MTDNSMDKAQIESQIKAALLVATQTQKPLKLISEDLMAHIESYLSEHTKQLEYWKQRCEAAESLIRCQVKYGNMVFNNGYEKYLEKNKAWQTLKTKSV